ncbi:MAG TPA: DUF1990 domain-containing protein [Acidimicrobiales bacterium]|nr:DUF1990 domain-containing protein [Acidimicrobiales bacterium]
MPLIAGHISERRLQAMADAAGRASLTYDEVGATAEELPPGFRHGRFAIDLGSLPETFERAGKGLLRWEAHRFAGATIRPDQPPLEAGCSQLVVLRLGGMTMVAPTRTVYVTDEPDRFGFAYGTLAGHPESGEEAFHITRGIDNAVRFEIVVFWRPSAVLARLGAPVSKVVQARVTKRYLLGIKAYVDRFAT